MKTILETAQEVLRLDGLATGEKWGGGSPTMAYSDYVNDNAPALAREVIRLAAEVEQIKHDANEAIQAVPVLQEQWQKKWMAALDLLDGPTNECIALRAEVEALREAQRWIPVGERMPPAHTYVLALASRVYQTVWGMVDGQVYWEIPGGRIFPTHWKEIGELPAPPEDAA